MDPQMATAWQSKKHHNMYRILKWGVAKYRVRSSIEGLPEYKAAQDSGRPAVGDLSRHKDM